MYTKKASAIESFQNRTYSTKTCKCCGEDFKPRAKNQLVCGTSCRSELNRQRYVHKAVIGIDGKVSAAAQEAQSIRANRLLQGLGIKF